MTMTCDELFSLFICLQLLFCLHLLTMLMMLIGIIV